MKLFEPGSIGKLSVRNRIVMAPIGLGGLTELDGRFSRESIDYFAARAKGGVGLIISCVTRASREIEQLPNMPFVSQPIVDNRLYVTRLNQLAEVVHDYGAVVAVQLTAGVGRTISTNYLNAPGASPVAPSRQPSFWNPDIVAHEMSTEQIRRLVQAFRFAAEILASAGVDAIELHGHEGYLFDQFKTALWNRRSDEYGRDLEGRLRFSIESIEAIKSGAGVDFPVIYRFGLTHYLEGGRGLEEGLDIAHRLEVAGVDALHVDAGCYETPYWAHPPTYQPPGCMVDLAEMTKKRVSIPVIAVGKLGYPELAESVLREGKADFVALGRPLLSDAEWPNKVRNGQKGDIRPCVGCHECLNRIGQRKHVSCAVNPAAGMERELTIREAESKRVVLVIGGGPSGMEAARVMALRGHKVTLWEKAGALGGKLIAASVPDFKQDYRLLIDYLSSQIRQLGVTVELGKEATPDLVREMKPDVVFVAVGSTASIPKITGVEKEEVVNAIDLLMGRNGVGESVVVLDGGLIGCEVALHLAQRGKQVTIVAKEDRIARHAHRANRLYLEDLLSEAGVSVMTETRILEVNSEGITIMDRHGATDTLAVQSKVYVPDLVPNRGLFEALEGRVPELRAVGDCVAPRDMAHAIRDAFRKARLV